MGLINDQSINQSNSFAYKYNSVNGISLGLCQSDSIKRGLL